MKGLKDKLAKLYEQRQEREEELENLSYENSYTDEEQHQEFHEYLNAEPVNLFGVTYLPSDIMKKCGRIHYDTMFNDWVSCTAEDHKYSKEYHKAFSEIQSDIDSIDEEIDKIEEINNMSAEEIIMSDRFEILRENGMHVLYVYDIEIEFIRRGREVFVHVRDTAGEDIGSDEWNKKVDIGIKILQVFFEDFEIIL